MSALKEQQGGSHYRSLAIQPVEYIHKNKLGFCEGSVIKYVTRWREKNGLEDLKKAKHFIELLMEMEGHGNTRPVEQGGAGGRIVNAYFSAGYAPTPTKEREWVKVSAPSHVPTDLKSGDELECFGGPEVCFVKQRDGLAYRGYDAEGAEMYVEFDEITAYRRNS